MQSQETNFVNFIIYRAPLAYSNFPKSVEDAMIRKILFIGKYPGAGITKIPELIADAKPTAAIPSAGKIDCNDILLIVVDPDEDSIIFIV